MVCNDTSEKNYSDISKDLARATERRQREWERERRQEERKREAFRRQSQRTAEACVRNPESRSCQNRLTNSIMDGVFGR